jgi:hypothetical protein
MKKEIKIGDVVVRNLAGTKMQLRVTDITDDLIICGGNREDHVGWWFDKETGAEVDDELMWGPKFGRTGSCLEQ